MAGMISVVREKGEGVDGVIQKSRSKYRSRPKLTTRAFILHSKSEGDILTWGKDDVAIELSVGQTALTSESAVEVSELVVLHADQITVALLQSCGHQGLRFLGLRTESIDSLTQLRDVDILRSIADRVLEILVVDVHFVGEVDRFQRQALVCGKVISEEGQVLTHSFVDKETWIAEC